MRLILIFAFLLSVILFENCGSTSGSGGGFNINTTSASSTSAALTASPISLSPTSGPVGSATAASSQISGANLNSLTCSWVIGTTSVAGTMSGTLCMASLIAPSTAGIYEVTVTVTNSGGETSSNSVGFSATSTTGPLPSPTVAPKPSPTAAPNPPGPSPTPVHVPPRPDPCGKCIMR